MFNRQLNYTKQYEEESAEKIDNGKISAGDIWNTKYNTKILKMTIFTMLKGLKDKIKNFDRKWKPVLKNT